MPQKLHEFLASNISIPLAAPVSSVKNTQELLDIWDVSSVHSFWKTTTVWQPWCERQGRCPADSAELKEGGYYDWKFRSLIGFVGFPESACCWHWNLRNVLDQGFTWTGSNANLPFLFTFWYDMYRAWLTLCYESNKKHLTSWGLRIP